MSETKQQRHTRLARLHLDRIVFNPGGNPDIERENDKHLKLANWHIRQAGGVVKEDNAAQAA